ncbi:MAG: DUF1800 domain-containing protein [Actinomycetota bacterium]
MATARRRRARPRPRRRPVAAVRRVTRRIRRLALPPAPPFERRQMTVEMVERLFWRAGFGPSQGDRDRWTGRTLGETVDALLATPQGPLAGPAPARNDRPASPGLDPKADDADLVLTWLDRMIRVPNPLPERLAFFWHRHWATSRADVSPVQLMIRQNELFRRHADLGANPGADFRTLAHEVGEDPAMLRFLTGEANVKGRPNENYARELMELFCLGPLDPAGTPNYTEDDVRELARAMSGWRVDTANPDDPKSYFTASRWDGGVKTVLGQAGAFGLRDATDVVLSHPAHPGVLLRKLWSELVTGPPDDATLQDLVATYTATGRRIAPVLRKILTHPQLFDSLGEPSMIKPPIVYVAGAMRGMGVGVTDRVPYDRLNEMGQQPYFPPNVSGWEYGLAWLTTNTAIARWRFASYLVNRADVAPQDVPGETPDAAVDRAHAACGRPWLSAQSRVQILDYATRARVDTAGRRRARQLLLRAMIIAGPDGQVM